MKESTAFSNSKTVIKGGAAFGIDLGTTNSCIGVVGNTEIPTPIELTSGKVTMPSCVLWDSNKNEFITGDEAYSQRYKSNACYSVKRLMGTDELVTFQHGTRKVTKTPAEVSSIILKGLVEKASQHYKDIKDVVITVPAEFNNRQIQDTIKAAELAELNVLNIMREPTAASIVYKLDKDSCRVLVYDLGGGTFDVSLVEVSKPTSDESEGNLLDILGIDKVTKSTVTVKATRGDTHLGGDDLDEILYKTVEGRLKSAGCDIRKISKSDKEKIKLRLESYKKLGEFTSISMNIDLQFKDGVKSYQVPFTLTDIKDATRTIFEKTKKYVDDLLKADALGIDAIVLVGGSTKNEFLKELLRKEYSNVELYDYLNPDESVALGAAINAKRLKFGSDSLDVFDVTSGAINILADERLTTMIEKNQSIPFSVTRTFSNSVDNQETMNIEIYEGSSIYKQNCTYLGNLIIRDIPKGPKNTVGVKVTLTIDTNGVLKCCAETSNGSKDIELVNLLGRKVESEDNTKSSVVYDRWYALANSLESDEDRTTLIKLIEESREEPNKKYKVIEFIKNLTK